MQACVLCREPGGQEVWTSGSCRVVVPTERDQPGLVRVVLNRHVAEMSDLDGAERDAVFGVVMAVEVAVRRLLAPDKINLASLGNLVPHVHWHVIPRWRDDPWFPAAIWAPAVRVSPARSVPADFPQRLGEVLRVSGT